MAKADSAVSSVEVYRVGSMVEVINSPKKDDPIVATVNAILIRSNGSVSYECSWWSGTSVTTAYLNKHEVIILSDDPKEKTRIGFM